jgi:ABC-type sugar transport system ATPase subunit
MRARRSKCAACRAQASSEDVSFVLRRGEILSVIGLLGAGRTELALALFGVAPFERGEILLDGAPLHLRSNQDAVRGSIAYVSEDPLTLGLNLKQSIADNVAITVLDRLADAVGLVAPGRRRGLASDWIARLGIRAPNADAAVLTLSGGDHQRVVLAKWLATDPKVLILDSPTVGVDVRNKAFMNWCVAWRIRAQPSSSSLMRSRRSITIPTAFCTCAMGGSSVSSSRESTIDTRFRRRSMLKLVAALFGRTESVCWPLSW